MKKTFEITQEYPGSLPLGTILVETELGYFSKEHNKFVPRDLVENNTSFFEEATPAYYLRFKNKFIFFEKKDGKFVLSEVEINQQSLTEIFEK